VEPPEVLPPGWSRDSGVVLETDGRFTVRGEPVVNDGIAATFRAWLDRRPDGRWVLVNRTDPRNWAWREVKGAPLHAARATVEGDRATLELLGGDRVALERGALEERDDGLYARDARGWEVRLAPQAALDLAEWLESGGAPAARSAMGDSRA
jgi:hypothetical protein